MKSAEAIATVHAGRSLVSACFQLPRSITVVAPAARAFVSADIAKSGYAVDQHHFAGAGDRRELSWGVGLTQFRWLGPPCGHRLESA